MASKQDLPPTTRNRPKSQQSIINQLRTVDEKSNRQLMIDSQSRIPIAQKAINQLEDEGVIQQVPTDHAEDRVYTLVDDPPAP